MKRCTEQTYPQKTVLFSLFTFRHPFHCNCQVVPAGWTDADLAADWEDIRSLRRLVFRAIEAAKLDGAVKTSADARVTVSVDAQRASRLAGVSANLRQCAQQTAGARAEPDADAVLHGLEDLFMCSEFAVVVEGAELPAQPHEHTVFDEDLAGSAVRVYVAPAAKHKCQRCWRFAADPEHDPETALCGRCGSVLARMAP